MGRLFGTDGVRGLANTVVTAELALDLSVAAAHVLGEAGAFSAGTGPLPSSDGTPGSPDSSSRPLWWPVSRRPVSTCCSSACCRPRVSRYLTEALEADLGVVLSASHNPMPDNGIKFLARGGLKLDDAVEAAIEKRLREPWDRPTGGAVGRVSIVRRRGRGLRRAPRLDRGRPARRTQGRAGLRPRRRLRRRSARAA